jgi:cytochrome c oxidase subunit II
VRRGAIVRILGLGIVITILVGLVAVLIPWLPDPASEQMKRIEDVYWFATIICIGIFALVVSVLIYCVMTFRAAPEDESDGPSIHGHTGLEIVWTVVPAILVIAIGVVSAVVLSQNGNAGNNPMTIKVFAQQFSWRFEYVDSKVKSYELMMPLDRNITFELNSADVIHSFWIPEFYFKMDVVPGKINTFDLSPTREGVFTGRCAELCGLYHSRMIFKAHVVSRAEYDAHLEELKKEGQIGAPEGSKKANEIAGLKGDVKTGNVTGVQGDGAGS